MSSKIPSLQALRGFAILGVLVIHCQWLITGPLVNDTPWFGLVANQLSRFAVPVFFMLSGYFFYPKLANTGHYRRDPIWKTLFRYCVPLFKLFIVWSVVYLLLPFNLGTVIEQGYIAERTGYLTYLSSKGLNPWFEGGIEVLWFLPGLICAMLITTALRSYWRVLWIAAIGLYLYGLAAGSYAVHTGWESPLFTRNGPFMSTLMVLIGMQLRQNNTVTFMLGGLFALIGVLGHLTEAWFLSKAGVDFNIHDFLLFTPLWGAGLVMMMLSRPEFGQHRFLQTLGNQSLGIYLIHIIFVILFMNLQGLIPALSDWKEYLIIPFTLFCSLASIWVIDSSPLRGLFLRNHSQRKAKPNLATP
ncbi:acyltransferase [Thaumasiovibrio subtropicus]|uniref:acyltransferase n=1 Tax=Thaumasiovibrio subtropicus TaxID=1891207 RepID=UPI000B355955|nr:acyltransferase family protein [Thaumasiovibrio subtropicus]